MRTFSEKQYKEYLEGLDSVLSVKDRLKAMKEKQIWNYWSFEPPITCNCRRSLTEQNLGPESGRYYFDECDNCLGFGYPPIPWESVI